MNKIIIAEFMDEAAVNWLKTKSSVDYNPELYRSNTELAAKLAGADALIVRNQTQVNPALLSHANQLKAVGRLGVGLDNIDLVACAERNIAVLPATGANSNAVAEYVIAGLLMLMRGSYHSLNAMLDGQWPRKALTGHEIAGKHLGLIGFGGIAQLVADKANALGLKISAYDPFLAAESDIWQAKKVSHIGELDKLLEYSDAVSLHLPLTEQTKHLLDASKLALMPKTAVLVQTSRGGIIDDAALAAALKQHQLGGAMLDVFENEPLTKDNPFHDCPNLILTPHIAGVTQQSNAAVSQLTAENVIRSLCKT